MDGEEGEKLQFVSGDRVYSECICLSINAFAGVQTKYPAGCCAQTKHLLDSYHTCMGSLWIPLLATAIPVPT
jgi:hypothetical protein